MRSAAAREIAAAVRTLGKGQLSRYGRSGPSETDRFEHELAGFVGTRYALAVNSGTSALMCALAALRVGPGDEVLVPAYTWVSTAAAVVAVGAVPVLVEIDESLTLDPVDVEAKITTRTKAVVPVHMLNLVCDMDRLSALARRHGLHTVEDACQAIGVTYRGRPVGSFGDAAAFSFNQHKNIRSGEGGAMLSDDDRTHTRALMFHDIGSYTRTGRAEHDEPPFVGLNLRMPELSSAILRPQLAALGRQMAQRRRRRAMLAEQLERRTDLTLSPHHSPADAVGLTVLFDDPDAAVHFARQPGVDRVLDTGRHVYTNWQAILGRRTFDPRVDPWVDSAIEYSPATCPRTLEILARTCVIAMGPGTPLPMVRRRARSLATAAVVSADASVTALGPTGS